MPVISGLYAIVDVDACEREKFEPLEVAGAFLEAEVPVLQLRAKARPDGAVLELLREILRLRGSRKTLVFSNDRPDLAALAGADGVHLGQDDFPYALTRTRFPQLAVGLSTHDETQLRAALALGPDYVALGPLRPTRSKERAEPVVSRQCLIRCGELARGAGIPLVGIGGLDARTIPEVAPHVQSVALIGALLAEDADETGPFSERLDRLRERARTYDALVRAS